MVFVFIEDAGASVGHDGEREGPQGAHRGKEGDHGGGTTQACAVSCWITCAAPVCCGSENEGDYSLGAAGAPE